MPMRSEDSMKALVDLAGVAESSLRGFTDAAKAATRPELKAMFQQCSADCATAAVELQALVDSFGGAPDDGGPPAGSAQRAWTRPDRTAGAAGRGLLEELEHAEERARARYAKALATSLPYQVRCVVQRQHDSILHNHRLIRELRERHEAALPPASAPVFANAQ
jgi:uncharacterized protein (TIGR02284 family)